MTALDASWNEVQSALITKMYPPSTSVPQRFDQQGESGCRVAAARVVEVVAREGRAPVGQHPDESPVGDVRLHLVLGQVGQAEPGQGSVEDQGGGVEHELAVDLHPELTPAVLKLPGIDGVAGRQAEADAGVR